MHLRTTTVRATTSTSRKPHNTPYRPKCPILIETTTINQHEEVLEYVLKCLTEEHLYISPKKLRPYAIRFNCLGHYRDENGLHASADKLELIRKWPMPSNYHDMQRFLGLVEYISRFLP